MVVVAPMAQALPLSPDITQARLRDIDQKTDGPVALDNHVRAARYDSRAAFSAVKQANASRTLPGR